MALRYTIYSALAGLGALAMVLALLWLNAASSAMVNVPAPSLPQLRQGATGVASTPPISGRNEVDAILAIDFSGSMIVNPGTDPKGYRLKAAELMATSLASDVFPRTTRMGYISFAQGAVLEQPLQPVGSLEARKALIAKVWDRYKKNIYGDLTEIDTAFELAYRQFFSGTEPTKNTPALVLLTDGEPIGYGFGKNTETGLREWVQRLTDRGVLIAIVILRPELDKETENLKKWRDIWNGIAEQNSRVIYAETRDTPGASLASSTDVDEKLESIYNKLRGRLVNEGTKPGDRQAYDPLRGSSIRMPPNLLQANLLVSKPSRDTVLELISPDGIPFSTLQQANKASELVDGELYARYRIAAPKPGNWTIRTTSTSLIYYVLNTESLFRPSVSSGFGAPYVQRSGSTQLLLSVVDEKGVFVRKPFSIEAAILKNVKLATGAIVEQESPVSVSAQRANSADYGFEARPDMVGPDGLLHLQISGKSDDGSLLNSVIMLLPVVDLPAGIQFDVPPKIVCVNEQLALYPPQIRCGNIVTATLTVMDANRLITGTLGGKLFHPAATNGEAMFLRDSRTLIQLAKGLVSAGTYGIAARSEGKVLRELDWSDSANATVQVTLPPWVDDWKRRLPIGILLFAILAVWKPLIVPLLLLLLGSRPLRPLHLTPRGFYSTDGGETVRQLASRAIERHKLFALTVGAKENKAADIRVFGMSGDGGRIRARGIGLVIERLKGAVGNAPKARIVSVPLVGLIAEDVNGVHRVDTQYPISIPIDSVQLQVSESNWQS